MNNLTGFPNALRKSAGASVSGAVRANGSSGFGRELAGQGAAAKPARAAPTPALAREMHLDSLLSADRQSFIERADLDERAKRLKLKRALAQRLQNRLAAAGAAR